LYVINVKICVIERSLVNTCNSVSWWF